MDRAAKEAKKRFPDVKREDFEDEDEFFDCLADRNLRRLMWREGYRQGEKAQTIYKTAIESILEMCRSYNVKKQFSAKAIDFWASVKIKCVEALQADQSLKESHWKPSEEDLTALEYCAEHTCPELLSLYLELKKLL